MSRRIEFWYEFASTYSYPAASRVERLARANDVEVVWRPFLLGPIFREQGWRDSPFNIYPAKGRYMWRDMERVCGDLGIPFRRPTVFPRAGVVAPRVALVADAQGWCAELTRAVYEANFVHDRDITDAHVLEEVLALLGRDADEVLERASSKAIKSKLRANVEEAVAKGIFGAPSFVVGNELYWGNDRLDAAISDARRL